MNESPSAPPVAPAAPVANQTDLEAVPSSWPGAFGAYKYSKAAVMFNIGTLVLLVVAFIAVSIAYSIIDSIVKLPTVVDQLVQLVLSVLLGVAEIIVLFAGLDRQKLTLSEAFEKSKPFVLRLVLLYILLYLIMGVSLMLLIVPFFFVMPRVLLAPYFLVRKNLGVVDSLKASWAQTKGHVGKVYGIIGVGILLALLAFTIIGIPFAVYFAIMYAAVFTVLYAYITEHGSAEAAPAAPVV